MVQFITAGWTDGTKVPGANTGTQAGGPLSEYCLHRIHYNLVRSTIIYTDKVKTECLSQQDCNEASHDESMKLAAHLMHYSLFGIIICRGSIEARLDLPMGPIC